MSANQTPVKVLRNKGIPVERYLLEQDLSTGAWSRTEDTETVHVQFTNAVLADIEDPDLGWQPRERSEEDKAAALAAIADGKQPPPSKGALLYWQDDMQQRPFAAIARTLALCWGWYTYRDGVEVPDQRRASLAMLDGRLDLYSGAVQGAYMLANGQDPERVGEYLAVAGRAAAAQRRAADAQMLRQIAAAEEASAEAEATEQPAEGEVTSEDDLPTTPTSRPDLADELAAKRPATARQEPRSTGTRGSRGSRAGRGSTGTTTSSGG